MDEDVYLDETLPVEMEGSSNLLRHTEDRESLASRLSKWKRPALSPLYLSHSKKIANSPKEAERLCDRIGVLLDGSLQCIGNAKQLKARYGAHNRASYVLTITTSTENEEEVQRLVFGLCTRANKVSHKSGTQKFELPKNEVRKRDVVELVMDAKSRFTVEAWGLADTTLEDVFVKVAFGQRPPESRFLASASNV